MEPDGASPLLETPGQSVAGEVQKAQGVDSPKLAPEPAQVGQAVGREVQMRQVPAEALDAPGVPDPVPSQLQAPQGGESPHRDPRESIVRQVQGLQGLEPRQGVLLNGSDVVGPQDKVLER